MHSGSTQECSRLEYVAACATLFGVALTDNTWQKTFKENSSALRHVFLCTILIHLDSVCPSVMTLYGYDRGSYHLGPSTGLGPAVQRSC